MLFLWYSIENRKLRALSPKGVANRKSVKSKHFRFKKGGFKTSKEIMQILPTNKDA